MHKTEGWSSKLPNVKTQTMRWPLHDADAQGKNRRHKTNQLHFEGHFVTDVIFSSEWWTAIRNCLLFMMTMFSLKVHHSDIHLLIHLYTVSCFFEGRKRWHQAKHCIPIVPLPSAFHLLGILNTFPGQIWNAIPATSFEWDFVILPVGCALETFHGSHLDIILIRYLNHLNWLLSLQRSSSRLPQHVRAPLCFCEAESSCISEEIPSRFLHLKSLSFVITQSSWPHFKVGTKLNLYIKNFVFCLSSLFSTRVWYNTTVTADAKPHWEPWSQQNHVIS